MNSKPKIDRQYEDALAFILANGKVKRDRTGVGTISYFGLELRYKLWESFPLITTKQVHLKSIVTELLWFLRGDTNIKWLQDQGCKIWDSWAATENTYKNVPLANYERVSLAASEAGTTISEIRSKLSHIPEADGHKWLDSLGIPKTKKEIVTKKGDLGPVYGAQWRSWPTLDGKSIDQIERVLKDLRTNPDSRRIIVSAWNVGDLDKMALSPCHAFFQFYSETLTLEERVQRSGQNLSEQELDAAGVPKRALSCKLTQRSSDFFIGNPFNIASYSLLVMMIAQQTNHLLGDFIWSGGDCHIYSNHVEQCKLQLSRQPYPFPQLKLKHRNCLTDYVFEDIKLVGLQQHEKIYAPVAV